MSAVFDRIVQGITPWFRGSFSDTYGPVSDICWGFVVNLALFSNRFPCSVPRPGGGAATKFLSDSCCSNTVQSNDLGSC